jgi:hypothetical protein
MARRSPSRVVADTSHLAAFSPRPYLEESVRLFHHAGERYDRT